MFQYTKKLTNGYLLKLIINNNIPYPDRLVKMNKANHPEKTIKSEIIYDGKIIRLRRDMIILPDNRSTTREIVEHPGAVVILAEKEEHKIILVKQYRKAIDKVLLELPAGTLEPFEKPLDCAKRELEEETGYVAKNWQEVFEFYSAPGFCNEKLTFYYASELSVTGSHTDFDEFIEIVEIKREEIKLLLNDKKIVDAKSLIGIQWWLNK